MWDPTTYLRYGEERGRPFADLVVRVPVRTPGEVVDLGCGPGTLTAGLTRRWPGARVRGVDSSAEMIESARALGSAVDFDVADVQDWQAGPEVDVVLANAVLQWVPDHDELLRRWAAQLHPGAVLAFQVPGNFTAPSHRAVREVASGPR
jgi:trans-aconitate 2-methyltransferase